MVGLVVSVAFERERRREGEGTRERFPLKVSGLLLLLIALQRLPYRQRLLPPMNGTTAANDGVWGVVPAAAAAAQAERVRSTSM